MGDEWNDYVNPHQARKTSPIQENKRSLGQVILAVAMFTSSNATVPARELHFETEVMFCQMNQVFISKRNHMSASSFPGNSSILIVFLRLCLTWTCGRASGEPTVASGLRGVKVLLQTMETGKATRRGCTGSRQGRERRARRRGRQASLSPMTGKFGSPHWTAEKGEEGLKLPRFSGAKGCRGQGETNPAGRAND